MSQVFRELRQLMARRLVELSEQYQGVVVACSGGLDSTVLFAIIFEIITSKKIEINLAICHTNFGLRGEESNGDQIFLTKIAKEHNVPMYLQVGDDLPVQTERESTQMWARRSRYMLFSELQVKGWVVALGHHLDDLSENIIFRMSRGVSLSSIPGMKEHHAGFWRPFLMASKADLASYASRHELLHRLDSSNAMMKYARNRIRKNVMPELQAVNSEAINHIAQFGYRVNHMMSYINAQSREILHRESSEVDGSFPVRAFMRLHSALDEPVLVQFLSSHGVDSGRLSTRCIDGILKVIRTSNGCEVKTIDLPGNFQLAVGEYLVVTNTQLDFHQTNPCREI